MRRKKKTKRRRRTRRTRRRSELDDITKFTLSTGKLLVQTSAVMGIARVASDVMKK